MKGILDGALHHWTFFLHFNSNSSRWTWISW